MPDVNNYITKMEDLVARELPGLDNRLLGLYTLLAFVKGENTNLVDVHDAWAVWRSETRPDHRSIVPFGELTHEVQELDRKYMEGIHRAVQEYQASLLQGR